MKICKKCNCNLPTVCFSPDKRSKDGLFSYCKDCNNLRTKERYWNDPEKARRLNRERDQANRQKARDKTNAWRKEKKAQDPSYFLWATARNRARKQNIPFNIERSDVVIPEYCPVLGIKLNLNAKRGFVQDAPSIDKIIPELGYTQGNIIVVSYRANQLKSNASMEEMGKLFSFYSSLINYNK